MFFEKLEPRCLLTADLFAADLDGDRRVDTNDIAALKAAIGTSAPAPRFDLDESGEVDFQDVEFLVETLLNSRVGDANLDGSVNFEDFLQLAANFANFSRPGTWDGGDFNLDGQVDFEDFLLLVPNFGFDRTSLGITHHSLDGNRYVEGWSDLQNATTIDIALGFVPTWVIAAPTRNGTVWVALADDGRVVAHEIVAGQAMRAATQPAKLPPGMPPILEAEGDAYRLIVPEATSISTLSHAVPTGEEGRVAYLDAEGNLVVERGMHRHVIEIDALPDGRVLSDQGGRFLVLSSPTSEYRHNVLGDDFEADSVTLVDTSGDEIITRRIDITGPCVIEGVSPIWTDIDGDGKREIIVTLSSANNGGQIAVYSEQGEVVASGPGIGRGFRWRHQIAVAPTGEQGRLELIDVLTPHIGGVVEFRDLADADLPIVAETRGLTSHVIRSRNLDMAAVADFDSDGNLEVLLPTQRRDSLAAVQRTEGGSRLDWQVPIGGRMTGNLAIARLSNGRLQVGVGRDDGTLRVWV